MGQSSALGISYFIFPVESAAVVTLPLSASPFAAATTGAEEVAALLIFFVPLLLPLVGPRSLIGCACGDGGTFSGCFCVCS